MWARRVLIERWRVREIPRRALSDYWWELIYGHCFDKLPPDHTREGAPRFSAALGAVWYLKVAADAVAWDEGGS